MIRSHHGAVRPADITRRTAPRPSRMPACRLAFAAHRFYLESVGIVRRT
ncbi:hypothetical protein C7S16_4356 [Burkholderia thailandensis]|uniref:Uncharacterized protein n=1 Tax=Burkholderia thailandensis TaxID=57975 RepID=A0AAW9CRC4_BURTH|nr:hypothetical protein [Burkholderia thailandensis]